MINLKEIQDFVKAIAKTGVSEVDIKTEEIKLRIKVNSRDSARQVTETTYIQQIPVVSQMPTLQNSAQHLQATTTTTTPIEFQEEEKKADKKYITIKSPMVGTFYRKPSPDKPFYVNVGDEIITGKVICIIEAMKLFNEIEAEITGKIAKILVEDSTPVEYDQPLFLVEP
jgi:acetyl-CoA carboxylase biotin carboxyl carrier protein